MPPRSHVSSCLFLLAGCGAPITNALFYEDQAFLDALPTPGRFAAPSVLLHAPSDADPVLAAAVEAAHALEIDLEVMNAAAAALTAEPPAERSETHRAWGHTAVTFTATRETWWIRGEVVRTGDDASHWLVEAAPRRDGPWEELASGQHGSEHDGTAVLHLDLLGGDDPTRTEFLDLAYRVDDEHLSLEVDRYEDPLRTEATMLWRVDGDDQLAFLTSLALTEDAAHYPATVVATTGPDGGRADGRLHAGGEDGDPLLFSDCWTPDGATTWRGGDPTISPVGSEDACVLDPLW